MPQRLSTSKPPVRSSRNSNPNVFSDDYALEEYEPVVDGRPPASDNAGFASTPPIAPTNSTTTPPRRSRSLQSALESPYGSTRRSRLSQRSTGRDSTISHLHDGSSRQSVSDLGRTLSTQHRSIRTISSLGIPRAQSPYRGPTGPSQPYGMFTQDVSLARSPSTATTSTIRPPERAYSGPAGPTQPYGMYSQNTMPEDDHEVTGMAPALPAFAGIPPATQSQAVRRLGPDGEDADDIIGPDGYTEQLPPYSRYANGIPPKIDPAAANIPPHLNPDFPSQVPPENAQAGPSEYYRPEPREMAPSSPVTSNPFEDSSAALSSTLVPSSPPPNNEKATFKDRVKRGSNRRVCCGLLPCWALAFMVLVLFAAILLGGIVGGLVAHHTYSRHPEHYTNAPEPVNNPVTITTTTLADASPIPTPTNLPTLPTGTFSYVLDNPVPGQNSNTCLPIPQRAAWDCPTGANLNVSISMLAPHTPQLSISYTLPSDPQMPNPPNPQIRYGAQPPTLNGPVDMNLMRDKMEWSNGPAFFFQETYNKTVILKSTELPGEYQKLKRSELDFSSIIERRQSSWVLNEFVNIADKPWYCFWNGTFLEGFVYVTQNEGSPKASNAAAASSFASATATATATGYSKKRRQAGLTTKSNTYPKVIKIEERRPLRNPPQPYCQQMQIMNNGQPAPYEPDGQPIIFNLTETEPQPLQQQAYQPIPPSPPLGTYKEKRQAGPNSYCMCEWQN